MVYLLDRRVHKESAEGAAELSLLLSIPVHLLGRFLRAAPHLRRHVTVLRAGDADAGVGEYSDKQSAAPPGMQLHKEMQEVFQDCPWTRVISLSRRV